MLDILHRESQLDEVKSKIDGKTTVITPDEGEFVGRLMVILTFIMSLLTKLDGTINIDAKLLF